MKKQLFFTFAILLSLFLFPNTSKAEINISDDTLYNNIKGKIILRVESSGEAYYVHPEKQKMYYLGRPTDAFQVMREQGIGISNKNLSRIINANIGGINNDIIFTDSQKGKILLQVEENGEAWYVSPTTSLRYYLGRPSDAFGIMRSLGLGISETDFNNLQQLSCPDNAIDEIVLSNNLFCAYQRNIIKVTDGNEKIIYTMNEQMPGEILGKFDHTPDKSTLLFKEMGGKMSPYLMAIDLSTNETKELDFYQVTWSPNDEYALLLDPFFDGAQINIALANDLYSSEQVISVTAGEWKSDWKDNKTFYFEITNIDECNQYFSDSYKEKGLTCGINEFKVQDYLK